MMEIRKNYIPIGRAIEIDTVKDGVRVEGKITRRPGTKVTNMQYIIVHNNGNKFSTLDEERRWLLNPVNTIASSWNLMIKGDDALEVIPWGEVSYNAGNYTANHSSYSVEIHDGGDVELSNRSAIKFISERIVYNMQKNTKDVRAIVKPHQAFTKTACPKFLMPRWEWFLTQIEAEVRRLTTVQDVFIKSFPTQGDSGPDVLLVQQILNKDGMLLAEDGHFGPATLKAVTLFQTTYRIPISGIVDRRTATQLERIQNRLYEIRRLNNEIQYVTIPLRNIDKLDTIYENGLIPTNQMARMHDARILVSAEAQRNLFVYQGRNVGGELHAPYGIWITENGGFEVVDYDDRKDLPYAGVSFSPSLYVHKKREINLRGLTFLSARARRARLAFVLTSSYVILVVTEGKDPLRGFTGLTTYEIADVVKDIVYKVDPMTTNVSAGELGTIVSCVCDGRDIVVGNRVAPTTPSALIFKMKK